MKRSSYRERDDPFGQAILHLRTCMGLTQTGLADQLGISHRAVGKWEAGKSSPKAGHLKHLIELAIKHQAFPTGHEEEAIRQLWQAVHRKTALDEQWLSSSLMQQRFLQPPSAAQ